MKMVSKVMSKQTFSKEINRILSLIGFADINRKSIRISEKRMMYTVLYTVGHGIVHGRNKGISRVTRL